MPNLGKIEKIEDLRTIWPHEARDFSKWMSKEENLALLCDAVGIDIVLEELESPVGDFNVDLFAVEAGTNRKIVIENQLEDTNHDHLGKIITYASGKGAEVIIWVVKRARDEHKQAVEWLNQHTDENIGFFLLEIELWKIDDSLPAPRFNVVERPNDWAKSMKKSEGLSDIQKLQLEYWQAFNEYSFEKTEFRKVFSKRKPPVQSWYSLSVGSSIYNIDLDIRTQKKCIESEIYFHGNKEIFESLKEQRYEIEKFIGEKLEWRSAAKDCRIVAIKNNVDVRKETDKWSENFDWYCEMALKFYDVIKKFIVK